MAEGSQRSSHVKSSVDYQQESLRPDYTTKTGIVEWHTGYIQS